MAHNKLPSLDKSGSALKTETNHTEKLDSEKRSVQLSSSDDKKLAGLDPKYMRIKILKSAHYDKSYPRLSASLYIGHIPRKKQKKKVSKTSITGNKVTRDQNYTNKEAKVVSSIEGEKTTSVCVTPHPSVLTPPPYKNKQDYKGGTNDKTHYSHTRETGVSRSDDDSLARNLDTENKNTEDDEYIDHLSIKMIKLILNHMKKSEKYSYLKKNQKR